MVYTPIVVIVYCTALQYSDKTLTVIVHIYYFDIYYCTEVMIVNI